jgi:hypothetical protein
VSKCGLCKKDAELKISHLMPKSLYRALRDAFPESGRDLVFLNKQTGNAIFTDHQVKIPFLCFSCEQRFNKYGENHVVRECHRGDGKFILLNKLKSLNASIIHNGEKWINPAHHQILHPDQYLYFAASIIWRASTGNWGDEYSSYKEALGDKYQEQIRTFLLGETVFPKDVYIAIYVDNDRDIFPVISFPTVTKKDGYHHHIFYIPGIKFSIIIGGKVEGVNELYAKCNSRLFFVEYSFSKHKDYKLFHRETKYGVTAKGRLANSIKK